MVKEFTESLSVLDRLEQLVNNDYFADIVFLVGNKGERMYGHKNILTLASEVFFAQFNGLFVEGQQCDKPISVTDIEPETFRDILRYMYCQKINLTKQNVTEVYYASQKYMLLKLNEMCEHFFAHDLDESNVLKVFDDNRKHEFTNVNELCLAIIRNNPLACFKHEDFFTLEKESLEIIVRSTQINCCANQMQEAIQNWGKVNELQFEDAKQLAQIVLDMKHREFDCDKLYGFAAFQYANNIQFEMTVKSLDQPVALYGMGIFVKSESKPNADENVTLSVSVTIGGIMQYSETRIVPLTKDLRTEAFLFEKILLNTDSPACKITVVFVKPPTSTKLFCLNAFSSIDKCLNVTHSTQCTNCVAYLLYKQLDTVDSKSQ